MKNNTIIFICTHKDFVKPVNNNVYSIINSNEIREKTNLPLNDDFYLEFYQFKYVIDNVKLPKYVGFCHYRRYFSFLDNIPDMNEIVKNYDCIIGMPIEFNSTVKEQYGKSHNSDDLNIIEDIIKKKYKSYSHACDLFLKGKIIIPCNMFIMKRSDFKKYCKFIFGVLDEYLKITGTDINKRINDNKEKYIKTFSPNDTAEYQYRIGGFIGERLTNIFMMKHFKKMKSYNILITEEKYTK